MAEDPIVDELHKIREQLLDEHGGLEGFVEHLQAMEQELKNRIVKRAPRPPITTTRRIS